MPRISGTTPISTGSVENPLLDKVVDEIVNELRSDRDLGWPIVIETAIPRSSAKTITVIWDKWQPFTDEFRIQAVLKGIEKADGQDAIAQVAAVEALTIPEARDAGRLPFMILPLRRKDDPVTEEDCRSAMIRMGGSVLEDPRRPELRFPSEVMAEMCREALIQSLPGSENVWSIAYDGPPAAYRNVS